MQATFWTINIFRSFLLKTSQVYLQKNKKKAEAEGKNCHAKTMWSQEKPNLQLV